MVQAALAEDIGSGDVTSLCAIPEESMSRAVMVAREPLVACGLELAEAVFRELAPKAEVTLYPWKDTPELKERAVEHVRTFLGAHQPVAAH